MLKLSKNVGLTDIISASNQLSTQHVNSGESKEIRVWLFNDAAAKKYEGVTISAVDTQGTDESSWIKFAPDNGGTAGIYAPTLNMANISDANVGKPFWVKITSAAVTDAQNKSDLNIRVVANEFAV